MKNRNILASLALVSLGALTSCGEATTATAIEPKTFFQTAQEAAEVTADPEQTTSFGFAIDNGELNYTVDTSLTLPADETDSSATDTTLYSQQAKTSLSNINVNAATTNYSDTDTERKASLTVSGDYSSTIAVTGTQTGDYPQGYEGSASIDAGIYLEDTTAYIAIEDLETREVVNSYAFTKEQSTTYTFPSNFKIDDVYTQEYDFPAEEIKQATINLNDFFTNVLPTLPEETQNLINAALTFTTDDTYSYVTLTVTEENDVDLLLLAAEYAYKYEEGEEMTDEEKTEVQTELTYLDESLTINTFTATLALSEQGFVQLDYEIDLVSETTEAMTYESTPDYNENAFTGYTYSQKVAFSSKATLRFGYNVDVETKPEGDYTDATEMLGHCSWYGGYQNHRHHW